MPAKRIIYYYYDVGNVKPRMIEEAAGTDSKAPVVPMSKYDQVLTLSHYELHLNHTVASPESPCEFRLADDGLHEGQGLVIVGIVPANSNRFSVNFKATIDIAFQLTVVVPQKGVWSAEEREAPSFPFTPRNQFQLKILCRRDHFEIFVNTVRYCTFAFRRPLESIDVVAVSGNVQLKKAYLLAANA